MPPRSQSQGESKRGLIITLVFFILATLGLGVSTYFGFAEQDKLDKAAKEAKKSEDNFKGERDYYKAQAMVYRGYMGMTEGMDGAENLGTLKGQLDSGSLGKSSKDNADVKKVLETLNNKYGWPNNSNQPKESLEGKIKRLEEAYDRIDKQKGSAEKESASAKKDKAKAEEELAAAQTEYKKNLDDLAKKYSNDEQKSRDDLAQFRGEVDRLSKVSKGDKEKAEEEKNALIAQAKKKDEDMRFLRQRVKEQENRLNALEARNQPVQTNMRPDWKIMEMDTRGSNPYINLGSADRVQAQLTFTIHGVGADGRINPQPKGTLEVINVIGPHLSQTRVTSVRDRNRDPIVKGDVIANSSWDPNMKKHVAVAGIIDLTGDGRDSLFEFMRNLERQNIVVDAYLNPKDAAVKGQITFRTDYLIVGGFPDSGGSGRIGETEKQFQATQKQMQEEARKYGAQVVSLARYLEMIGYHLPHSTRERSPSMYNSDLRPDRLPRVGGDRPLPTPPTGDNAPPPAPTVPDK
ncbi:MAG: hypothetical protein ACYC3I_09835 [Gemmataceae bacterium]